MGAAIVLYNDRKFYHVCSLVFAIWACYLRFSKYFLFFLNCVIVMFDSRKLLIHTLKRTIIDMNNVCGQCANQYLVIQFTLCYFCVWWFADFHGQIFFRCFKWTTATTKTGKKKNNKKKTKLTKLKPFSTYARAHIFV